MSHTNKRYRSEEISPPLNSVFTILHHCHPFHPLTALLAQINTLPDNGQKTNMLWHDFSTFSVGRLVERCWTYSYHHHSPCPNNLWCVFNLFLLPSALLAELHLTPTIFDMTVRCEMTSQPQLNWSDNLANTADIKRSGENGLQLNTFTFNTCFHPKTVEILFGFNSFGLIYFWQFFNCNHHCWGKWSQVGGTNIATVSRGGAWTTCSTTMTQIAAGKQARATIKGKTTTA